ncbi:MAG: SIS domain-containing protein [Stellaceae bacterium]
MDQIADNSARVIAHIDSASALLQATAKSGVAPAVEEAAHRIARALSRNLPLLVCGNGGSAADSSHIAGELVGRFLRERRALKCISLAANTAVLTAWGNDYSYDTVFARQVEALGEAGGVLWGISTSGNSRNVVEAFKVARSKGMLTIALTGKGGGKLAALADILIDVPSTRTPDIQQVHLVLYHYICERVEELCVDIDAVHPT